MSIHTVIFDLDGTLSDSSILTVAAFERILPGLGVNIPSGDAVRRATGYANPEFYHILFPGASHDVVGRIGELVEREELRILPSLGGKLLFKGCRELLDSLREQGIRLCIASTGDTEHVHSILNESGITGYFDRISCNRPDKTEMLCEMLGDSDPNGYLMVGDMKKDHDGAKANNIRSVGACYGYCVRDLTDFDIYIDTPSELLEVINKYNMGL